VQILYGKSKKPIALIVPLEKNTSVPRKIGVLEGIASYREEGAGKITTEEFLGL
jgi:hypothetical protein